MVTEAPPQAERQDLIPPNVVTMADLEASLIRLTEAINEKLGEVIPPDGRALTKEELQLLGPVFIEKMLASWIENKKLTYVHGLQAFKEALDQEQDKLPHEAYAFTPIGLASIEDILKENGNTDRVYIDADGREVPFP